MALKKASEKRRTTIRTTKARVSKKSRGGPVVPGPLLQTPAQGQGDITNGPHYIVGIGASAGGLDALQRFLAVLPQDFVFALVFVQHLSAKHKSLLHELLSARRPSLVIQEISDGLKIQPGRLYLAPPGREVRLQNSLFQTTVHPEGLIHLPIDEFLSSLAGDAGERSIAVIFSGTGTDGARGCQAVRSVGGTVFVQDPQTAEFDSMPLAAIATGQADAVLSPEDIAAELLKLQGISQAAVGRELLITPEEFDGFFQLLREKTGSRFDHYKKSVVSRRIRRRMYLHGFSAVKEYLDLISTADPEAALLASDLMIGVTSFFRDRVAWKALSLEAVRKIVSENSDLPVRVWTPASATGEEAYSIAMMLLRELALAGKNREVQVFATDVNDRALERAREGKYPASIIADVAHEYLQNYFTSTDDGNFLVINKEVRECVVFARQDLLIDPPFSKLDLIICRNFLIYLEPEAQEKSITLFHYALKESGFLFLGNAETVGRKSALFKSIGHKQCRIYRKLETKLASRLPLLIPYATERQAQPAKQAQMTGQNRSVMEIIQEKLLEEYGPVSVAIDQNYEIIYHNGPTNRYLVQPRGVPTQNVLELMPENLRSRIRGALYRSGREERPVIIRTSVAGDDNKKRYVVLRITKAAENLSLLVFQEKRAPSTKEAAEQLDAAVIEETAIHQLESELSATRVDLQSHIEQLKSMNEEFQSSNEELQAANEELETSREELQSLNEELITVNSQLQGKIEEQDATNNDLNNFQASTNIPTIFLDTDFRVKRFTPAMLRLIQLLPSDVGRPIVDLSRENLGPDLTSDAQAVLEQLAPVRRELELSGAWYVRTTLPYRTADNRIEGVIITYSDVSELKREEERSRHLASFPQLNPNPVIEVDASGGIIFANPGIERILTNLGMDKGDIAVFLPNDLDVILKDLDKDRESSISREVIIKDRVFNETIQLVPQFKVARIYAYDITKRKQAEEALRQSEKRFRLLVESVKDYAIFMLDPEGRVSTWNYGAERLKGYKAEEITGQHFSLFYPAEDAANGKPQRELNAATTKGEFEEEGWRVRKDGSRFWASVLITALRDDAGSLLGFTKVTRDITERKKAEEALKLSEEQFRTLADSIPNLAWWATADGYITWYNQRWYEYTGTTPEQMEGWGWQSVHDPNVLPKVMERWQASLATGASFDMEFPLLGSDGIYRSFLTRVMPQKDSEGKVLRWFGTNTDISALKQAEEALQASEAKYRSLFDNMINGFAFHQIVVDEAGKPVDYIFREVNSAFEKLTGLKAADIQNKNATQALPGIEKDPADWIGVYGKVALTGAEIRFEQYAELLGRWYSVIAYSPRRNYFATVFEDITERKQAEESLRESEERLKLTYQAANVGAFEWNVQTGVNIWTPQLEAMYGLAHGEFGKTQPAWEQMVHPEDRAAAVGWVNQAFETGEPVEGEWRVVWRDNSVHWIAGRFQAFKDANGKPMRLSGVNMDITERKWIEEVQVFLAQAVSETQNMPFFNSLAQFLAKSLDMDFVCIDRLEGDGLSARTVAVWCDGHFEDNMTYALKDTPCGDVVGKTVCCFPASVCQFFPRDQVLQDLRAESYVGVTLWSHTGLPIGLIAVIGRRPLANRPLAETILKIVAVRAAGEMERMEAEESLASAHTELEHRAFELNAVNRELESFAYTVSHDLKAPLRSIEGFVRAIEEDYSDKLDEPGKDYVRRVTSACQRMTQLIDAMLSMSRLTRGELREKVVDLSSLVQVVAHNLRIQDAHRQVEFIIAEKVKAKGDAAMLEVVLQNLLDNAWKFTGRHSSARIEFGALDTDGQRVYFIKDDGAGFDMQYAGKLFMPFKRMHTEAEFSGLGIGLAIAHRIIMRHNGRMWAESAPEKGATIFFTL